MRQTVVLAGFATRRLRLGTQVMASDENNGRVFAMEIRRAYADVAIEHWRM